MRLSDFMNWWKTTNDILVSFGSPPLSFGDAKDYYQQYKGSQVVIPLVYMDADGEVHYERS